MARIAELSQGASKAKCNGLAYSIGTSKYSSMSKHTVQVSSVMSWLHCHALGTICTIGHNTTTTEYALITNERVHNAL